jgi:hypothetical protein
MISDVIYAVALIFYMQALPVKLIAISAAVNVLVLVVKLTWEAYNK